MCLCKHAPLMNIYATVRGQGWIMNAKITPDLYHCTFRSQSIFRVYVEVLVYLSTIQACVFWWKCVCAPHMFKGWISSWSDTIWPAGAEGRRIRECGNNRVVQYNNKHGLQICLTPQTNTEEIWDDRHIFCISRIKIPPHCHCVNTASESWYTVLYPSINYFLLLSQVLMVYVALLSQCSATNTTNDQVINKYSIYVECNIVSVIYLLHIHSVSALSKRSDQ